MIFETFVVNLSVPIYTSCLSPHRRICLIPIDGPFHQEPIEIATDFSESHSSPHCNPSSYFALSRFPCYYVPCNSHVNSHLECHSVELARQRSITQHPSSPFK